MRRIIVIALVCACCWFSYLWGSIDTDNRNAAEIYELLESQLRLQAVVAVYEHKYGPLTENDAKKFLEKKHNSTPGQTGLRIGPI